MVGDAVAEDHEAAERPDLLGLALAELERLEQCWSRFRSDSELSRLNASAGEWTAVGSRPCARTECRATSWMSPTLPCASVSRQAMAAFLYRAINPGTADPVCTGTTRTFTDVPAGQFAESLAPMIADEMPG